MLTGKIIQYLNKKFKDFNNFLLNILHVFILHNIYNNTMIE